MKTSKLLAAAAMAVPLIAWAEPNWLVTPQEAVQDAAWGASHPAPPKMRTRGLAPGTPDINVIAPASLKEPLKAPFPIRLAFKAKDGATIKPESFRALYGFLKIDITDRLAGRAKIGPEGIEVDKANIPAGNHRLVLRVSDDRDRDSEVELKFAVVE